jgi:ATP-dependent DNA helicase DinG
VIKARMEALEKKGRNSFTDFSLPDAVMKLRQGFGRLIRKNTDRGAVVILDTRIIRKTYGKAFTDSLPPVSTSFAPLDKMLDDMEAFIT